MSTSIVAVMPCLGRSEQTRIVVARLLATADTRDWRLVCIVDDNSVRLADDLLTVDGDIDVLLNSKRLGYWHSLSIGAHYSDAPLIVNLANDLLPGRAWLARALALSQSASHDTVIGFNDGYHNADAAAHMLMPRSLLKLWYGDDLFPLAYRHNFGDTEIVERAKRAKAFVSAPYAVLYHNHPVNGGRYDSIYDIGHEHFRDDEKLYHERMAV